MNKKIPLFCLIVALAMTLSACVLETSAPMTRVPHATLVPTETTVPPTTQAVTEPPTEATTQATEEPSTTLKLFEDVFLPLADGRLENSAGAVKALVKDSGYLYGDQTTGFIISNPGNPASFLSGEPRLWDDVDCVETLRFVMIEDKRQVELVLGEEPQFFIRDENGNNQSVSLEDLTAYIQNG